MKSKREFANNGLCRVCGKKVVDERDDCCSDACQGELLDRALGTKKYGEGEVERKLQQTKK